MTRRGTLLATAIVLFTRGALAQSPNAQAAEALFQEGLTMLQAGRTSEACTKFVESYRLDAANGTLQNVAACHEKEGKTATAWAEWLDLAGKAGRAEQREREQLARRRAAELSKDLPRLVLEFSRAPNVAEIVIDGQPILQPAWSSPIPLDPGTHAVIFRAPGKREAAASVKLEAGRSVSLAVPVLAVAPIAAAVPPQRSAPPEKPPSVRSPTLGYVIGGAGVVAAGVGAVFGLRAMSLKDEAACDGAACASARDVETREDAKTSATISTVGFGVGVVALAVGAYLVLTSGPSKSPSGGARSATAPGLRGLVVRF